MKRILTLLAMVMAMALSFSATTTNADNSNWMGMTNGQLLTQPLIMTHTPPEQLSESQRQRALVVIDFSQTTEGLELLKGVSVYELASFFEWTSSVAKQPRRGMSRHDQEFFYIQVKKNLGI